MCDAGIHPLVGDGICNDETNIQECDYDGFDCCLPNVNRDSCLNCTCFCKMPELVGNRFCNNETNNAECNYDDGECCGPDISCK